MADSNIDAKNDRDWAYDALNETYDIAATIAGAISLMKHSTTMQEDLDVTNAFLLLSAAQEQLDHVQDILDVGSLAMGRRPGTTAIETH